jgi:hypothetical protein
MGGSLFALVAYGAQDSFFVHDEEDDDDDDELSKFVQYTSDEDGM